MFGSGNTTLIILNEEMNDIMKKIKSLEESALLIKGVSNTIKKWSKISNKKKRFLRMLLGTLGANLLGNLLKGQGRIRAGEGAITSWGQGTIRASQDF